MSGSGVFFINPSAIGVISLYKNRNTSFDTTFTIDHPDEHGMPWSYKEDAQVEAMLSVIDNEATPAFQMALLQAVRRRLLAHDAQYDTRFAEMALSDDQWWAK